MCDNDSMDDMIEYTAQVGRAVAATVRRADARRRLALDAAGGRERRRDQGVGSRDQDAGRHLRCVLRASRQRAQRPRVLVWPDIFGLRPAFRQMGKRLAESGYSVLVVNPFYRTKKAPTAPANRATSRTRRRARRSWTSRARSRRTRT